MIFIKCKYDLVMFDLDGTISDSAKGIRIGLQKAIAAVGIDVNGLNEFFNDFSNYVGPPIINTMAELCNNDPELVPQIVRNYMEYYNTEGKYLNSAFEGIESVIKKLHDLGVKLAVCTSKRQQAAEEVLNILGLSQYFDLISGSKENHEHAIKKDNIPYTIQASGFTLSDKIVLIGDTKFDAEGALLCNIDFIGVLYGVGTKEQMELFGAVNFARTPDDILGFLC